MADSTINTTATEGSFGNTPVDQKDPSALPVPSTATSLLSEGPSPSTAKFDQAENALREEEEQRKLWAMAARSAANFITNFSLKKPAPDIEELKKTLAPLGPRKWAKLRKKYMNATSRDKLAEESSENIELRYDDQDTKDDDLNYFEDTDTPNEVLSKKSFAFLMKPKRKSEKAEKVEDALSGADVNEEEASDSQNSLHNSNSEGRSQRNSSIPGNEGGGKQDQRKSYSEERKVSSQNIDSGGEDEEDWDLYDDKNVEASRDADHRNKGAAYKIADVHIDSKEALIELEDLLEDMKLEGRITERYKFKLANKFTLLLQALTSSQENELEIIEHLQTKEKILGVLSNLLKAEEEAAASTTIISTADQTDETDKDSNNLMDFKLGGGRKYSDDFDDDGNEIGEKMDSQGLSIEEMSAGTIRETLLQQKNRLDVLESVKKIRSMQIKQLEFEKTLLALHYSRLVKPSELQKEIKDNRRIVNDLQLEISSIHQEISHLQAEVRNQEKTLQEDEKHVDKLELEALTKQNEVQSLSSKPLQLAKEADREAMKLEKLMYQHDQVRAEYIEGMETLRSYQLRIEKLSAELNELIRDEGKMQQQRKNSMSETESMLMHMETLLAKEQVLLEKITQLSEKIQQVSRAKKKLQEEQHRVTLEANKAIRDAQKLDRFIRMASESYINSKLAYEKMRMALDAATPKEDASNWEKLIKMLNKEIANLKSNLSRKLDEAANKGAKVETLQERINELYEAQVVAGKELQNLIRTTVKKRREREEKSEQCIKLEAQLARLMQDRKIQEIMLDDCSRGQKELSRQLESIRHKFNVIKLERTALMNDVISNRQKLVEAYERLKVCEGEINFINNRMLEKERDIKDIHYKNLNARLALDSVRNETMRKKDMLTTVTKEKTELMLILNTMRRELAKLRGQITEAKEQMRKLEKMCQQNVDNAELASKDICTFMEYIKGYDRILMRGTWKMRTRELEKSKLESSYAEVSKHLLIVKLNTPDEDEVFKKIESLREQVFQIVKLRIELEKKMNEDESIDRVRLLHFDWLEERENIPKLEQKLDRVEEALANRDTLGLEKALIQRIVDKVSDDGFKSIKYLKETYGEQVKEMVGIRKNLRSLSQKIEGLTSETAIAMAQAETAEQEYIRIKNYVQEAEKRLKRGQYPTIEMKREWEHKQWQKTMLAKARANKPQFYRPMPHRSGTQVQASRLRSTRRQLESPQQSTLGWKFDALNVSRTQFCGTRRN